MENFFITISSYLKVAGFLGLVESYPNFRKSKKIPFNVYIISTLLMLLIMMNVYHHILFLRSEGFFGSIIWSWMIMARIPSLLIQILIQYFYRNKLNNFIKFIFECDQKIKKIKVSVNHKKDQTIILLMIIPALSIPSLYFCLLIFYFINYNLMELSTIIIELSYTIDLIYSCFFCAQFVIFTMAIKNRFKILKKSLR